MCLQKASITPSHHRKGRCRYFSLFLFTVHQILFEQKKTPSLKINARASEPGKTPDPKGPMAQAMDEQALSLLPSVHSATPNKASPPPQDGEAIKLLAGFLGNKKGKCRAHTASQEAGSLLAAGWDNGGIHRGLPKTRGFGEPTMKENKNLLFGAGRGAEGRG